MPVAFAHQVPGQRISRAKAAQGDVGSTPRRRTRPSPTQVHCQPPAALATAATSGGPANWPSADHCWTQPTVVARRAFARRQPHRQREQRRRDHPPTLENSSTAA
jgi:hypothetical protein